MKKSIPHKDALEKLAEGKSTGDKKYDAMLKKKFKKDLEILKNRENIIWNPGKIKKGS